ncbi:MAG: hypothetical protein AAED33_13975 [Paracoccaceae bacterium]|jgi:hypothetical protein
MAQKSDLPHDDTPPSKSPEDRYLDLWEENIRLFSVKGLPKATGRDDA